ncbi:MAG: hypothetical protein M3P39_08940, partial [Actinomycetota bacterium]|nr:hypothetical protein [Actinomycetota bacterium]
MAGRLALVLAVAAGIALLVLLVGSEDRRLSGTNDVRAVVPVATVDAGRPVCQAGAVVPEGTAALAVLTASPAGAGRQAVVAT